MSRLTGPNSGRSRRTDLNSATTSPFDRPVDPEPTAPDALDVAFAEIEAGALEVYARAGLPTAPGHYRKTPDTEAWSFIAATLSPEARFALTLEHPAEMGWRFARLQDLGARSDRSDLQAASRLLNDIAELRTAKRGLLTQDHLLVAMELGGAWRALRDSKAVKASRLTLTPPTPPKKPRAKRDKSPTPR
ncbi:hypothetical protein [Brevundimonas sp. SL130]|uniref:hypothetical protein n=1 Tax=Brevundimonas sp. SL130 TaxID=2995143 RepID=UPI00226D12AC|nr:hypothetical protein [Brevundimonas sp. SL130]WAC60205.1 hypothetical protein OU998_01810 [Brevundimonas sp. SL130]